MYQEPLSPVLFVCQSQKQSQEKFYTMAAHIKLLLEIPERIWSAMESSQYLQATQLYLLCCHLNSQLHLEGGGPHYSPVLTRFPILVRQVAALGHFRYWIVHRACRCMHTTLPFICNWAQLGTIAQQLETIPLCGFTGRARCLECQGYPFSFHEAERPVL